jgi:hypothetical protein
MKRSKGGPLGDLRAAIKSLDSLAGCGKSRFGSKLGVFLVT